MSRSAHRVRPSVLRSRWPAKALALLLALAATGALPTGPEPAAVAAAAPTVWTDDFDGAELDPRWDVVNPAPEHLAVSGGALRINGQPGDTWQSANSARNVVMLDAVLDKSVDVADSGALGDAYAAQADWDPRGSQGYLFLVLRPVRIQAWREVDEIPGRTLMRDGAWLV